MSARARSIFGHRKVDRASSSAHTGEYPNALHGTRVSLPALEKANSIWYNRLNIRTCRAVKPSHELSQTADSKKRVIPLKYEEYEHIRRGRNT